MEPGSPPSAPSVRARVLEAGLHELASAGYAASSLERIAAAAGVTKPMVHYYFGSKLGLYEHALELAAEQLRVALGPGPAVHLPVREGLHELLAAVAAAGDDALRLLEATPPAEPDSPCSSRLEALLAVVLAPWLALARTRGELGRADELALAAVLATALSPRRAADLTARALWRRRVVELACAGVLVRS
jgi:AcrR family transcriptional regulator